MYVSTITQVADIKYILLQYVLQVACVEGVASTSRVSDALIIAKSMLLCTGATLDVP